MKIQASAPIPEGASPRPGPIPDSESATFWTACLDGRLLVQVCVTCGHSQLYGRSICTACHGATLQWTEASGRGIVYSRTVIRQNPNDAFKHLLPFVVALVDLDEGPRLLTNIVGSLPDEVQIGDRVCVTFLPISDDAALPLFELVQRSNAEDD